jgi:hypothetical protein
MPMSHPHRKKKSAGSSIISGIVFTLAFGIVWVVTDEWWPVLPMFFVGVLPLLEGIRRLLAERRSGRGANLPPGVAEEKQILHTAREEKGLVTPALVALKTSLSIAQAEQLLEKMARQGHAVMHVSDQGRIEYEFPEFVTRLEE